MARDISSHPAYALTRASAIAGIGVGLSGTHPTRAMRLLDEAVTVVQAVPERGKRVKGLAALAAQIVSVAPARAKELLRAGRDGRGVTRGWRLEALDAQATLALTIYPVDPEQARQLFDRARSSITGAVDVEREARHWRRCHRRIATSDPSNPHAIHQALSVVHGMPTRERGACGRALANIAEQVARHDPERAEALFSEAVALTRGPEDEDYASGEAAAEVAECIAGSDPADPELLSRALGLVETLTFAEHRVRALARIVRASTEVNRPERMSCSSPPDELAAAMADDSDGLRDGALACVAVCRLGSETIEPAAIVRAEARIRGLRDWVRFEALADIAQLVTADPGSDGTNLEEALRLVRSVLAGGHPATGIRALAGVATRLVLREPGRAQDLLDEATELALERNGRSSRDETLAHLAGCRRDLPGLRSLLAWDVEFGQVGRCLTIMQHFVEGAERTDTDLACAICTGVYLAMFEAAAN